MPAGLIVEDDVELRRLIKTGLVLEGFEVRDGVAWRSPESWRLTRSVKTFEPGSRVRRHALCDSSPNPPAIRLGREAAGFVTKDGYSSGGGGAVEESALRSSHRPGIRRRRSPHHGLEIVGKVRLVRVPRSSASAE